MVRGPGDAVGTAKQPRRRLRGPDRRNRIVAAALETFALRGYDATTMAEIADASAVSRPVLYDHFRSKRDLFLEVLERERHELIEAVLAASAGPGSAEGRIRQLIDTFFLYVEMHPATWRTLFQDVVGDREALAAQRNVQSEANQLIARRLLTDGGPLAGIEARATARLELLAELWGSGLNGLARWWYEHPEVNRAELVETALDGLWRGLRDLMQAGQSAGDRPAASRSL
jgi:AcrR family transcriptional regulator